MENITKIVIRSDQVLMTQENGAVLCATLVECRKTPTELLIVFAGSLIRVTRTDKGYAFETIKTGVILR